jgi:DNA-binding PadR family transcriptional regulator
MTPQTVAVLTALADEASRWQHGYELLGRTGLRSGTLYPILMRLADRGLLETAWEQDAPVGRPRRHLYRMSDAGGRALAEVQHRRVATRGAPGRINPAAAG